MDEDHGEPSDLWGEDAAEPKQTLDESFSQATVSLVRIRTFINDIVFMLVTAFHSVTRAFLSLKSDDSSFKDQTKE
jgi:hypothetical protein